jgi:hypothetical protein
MSDDDTPDTGETPNWDFSNVDFGSLLRDLRNQAWMKVGAIHLGSAVAEYRKAMIDGGMTVDEANTMTANTVKEIVQGFASAIPGIVQVAVQAAQVYEAMQQRIATQKEHPGKGERP